MGFMKNQGNQMDPLVEIRQLHLHLFDQNNQHALIKGIDLTVYPGEIVGIIGESGSGKTLTSLSILKLLPHTIRVTQGNLVFCGELLNEKTEMEMNRIRGKKIGMLFQDPSASLNPTIKVGHQIMESMIYHDCLSKQEAYQKTVNLLSDVGIDQPQLRVQQFPHQLSGGLKQRVTLALALACDPYLLIADEPTTALDVSLQHQILDLLKKIQSERKMSVLFISHDFSAVSYLCDRVFVMYAGQFVESGPVNRVFHDPKHPYTKALMHSRIGFDNPKNRPLISLAGSPVPAWIPQAGCLFASRCPDRMRICLQQQPPKIRMEDSHFSCWISKKLANIENGS